MKNLHKFALLTALGLASVQGVFAGANNNDLILDINANDSGGTTEFDVNLGNISTFTPTPNYDLSSLVSGFNSYSSATVSGLMIGVVGGQNGQGGIAGTGNDIFSTTMRVGGSSYATAGTEGAPTAGSPGKAAIGSAGGITGTFSDYGVNTSTGDSTSWTSLVAKDTTTDGTANNSFSSYLGLNPMSSITGSTITLDLWKDTVTGAAPPPFRLGVYQGDLTLDPERFCGPPSLVYDVSAVPEPTTYGMLAGAGLLLVSFRNKLVRKNA